MANFFQSIIDVLFGKKEPKQTIPWSSEPDAWAKQGKAFEVASAQEEEDLMTIGGNLYKYPYSQASDSSVTMKRIGYIPFSYGVGENGMNGSSDSKGTGFLWVTNYNTPGSPKVLGMTLDNGQEFTGKGAAERLKTMHYALSSADVNKPKDPREFQKDFKDAQDFWYKYIAPYDIVERAGIVLPDSQKNLWYRNQSIYNQGRYQR